MGDKRLRCQNGNVRKVSLTRVIIDTGDQVCSRKTRNTVFFRRPFGVRQHWQQGRHAQHPTQGLATIIPTLSKHSLPIFLSSINVDALLLFSLLLSGFEVVLLASKPPIGFLFDEPQSGRCDYDQSQMIDLLIEWLVHLLD